MIKRCLLFLLLTSPLSAENYPQHFNVTADTVFYDNFESGLNGWTAENLSNPQSPSLWRITGSRYISPSYSAAWNDSITNSYPHLRYEALISPPVEIPSNAKVILSFDVFIHLAPDGSSSNDNFDIQITTDNGSNWTDFSAYAYSGQQIGWKNFPADFAPAETGDLTLYAGKTVKFRFLLTSDNLDPNGEGVYIDNFRIVKTDCETIDLFEPNNSSAQASVIVPGQNINAALCPLGDIDFYAFQVSQNDKINIIAEYSIYQITLQLFSPSGTMVAYTGNKTLSYNAPVGGIYKLKVLLPDFLNYTPDYNLYINVINTKPDMMTVTDIPGDQGLKVRLRWQYSLFDPPNAASTIKDYHIFRKVTDTLGLTSRSINIDDLDAAGIMEGIIISDAEEFWDYIATVPAISPRPFDNYTYTAPTLHDDVESTFRIAAVNKNPGEPVLWGQPGTGISQDNIAPQFAVYSVSSGSSGITLSWEIDHDIYTDVSEVKIFKGMFQRFAPLQTSMIAVLPPSSISYTDQTNDPAEYHYILGVTDLAGNISYSSTLTGTVTSVEGSFELPAEFFLRQNYPNPFNPSTTIEYNIPYAENVSLILYNVLGYKIKELAKGYHSPGTYMISLSAGDLPSGVYFYNMTAGKFSETRKLTVIK